ncbi:hypothetical protein GCM10027347_02540 [Larkinella harenae]
MKIRLYPNEFFGMLEYLRLRVAAARQLNWLQRSIYDQLLIEYWQVASLMDKIPVWKKRNNGQRYSLPVPLSVIRILYQEMQHHELSVYGQAFLARLDQELINLNG